MKRKSRSRSRSRSRSPFTVDWPARNRPPPIFQGAPLPQQHLRGPTLPVLQPPATLPQPSHSSYHHSYGQQPLHAAHEERIRRNIACVNCRNSKVRCHSNGEGRPCHRCEKLQIDCEVRKDHKRITKRNKLEDLEKELKSLKQAVNSQPAQSAPDPESNTVSAPSARTSTSGVDSNSSWASQFSRPSPTKVYAPPVSASRHVTTQVLTPHSETPGSVHQYQSELATRSHTAESRTLGGITVSGEDVDFYFDKYLQYYHPLLPVLRHRDPDACHEAHATLFWTILYVSSRRFFKSLELYNAIVDELSNTPWLMLSTASATLESVHALLIICNWPLPTIRILTDPCPSLLAVATVASMQLGLHLGKGTGEAFGCGERHNAKCTDEEAASTWLACCTLATRASTAAGIPPPSIQYDDQVCRDSLEGSLWVELIALYDIQKWLNRFHAAMAAQLASGQPISTMSVSLWESDFDAIKPSLVRRETDILRVAVLSARLEIQTYYLANPLSPPPPPLVAHIKSIFTTCRNLLNLLRTLDSSSDYLRHHSQWSFRALLDASSFIIFSLHQRTLCCSHLTDIEATELAREAWSALERCSVRGGDIAFRVSSFMETFWGIRDGIPRKPLPVGSWRTRLAVGVTFWCLKQIKISLVNAKKIPDDTKIGSEHEKPEKETPKVQSPPPETPSRTPHDPFLGVDWSFFIEDFGWSGAEFGYTG